jgi:hypothetical protein
MFLSNDNYGLCLSRIGFFGTTEKFWALGNYLLLHKHLRALSENEGILLANLSSHDTPVIAASDSPCLWAFKNRTCKAPFAVFQGSPTVSGRFVDVAMSAEGLWEFP